MRMIEVKRKQILRLKYYFSNLSLENQKNLLHLQTYNLEI